MISQKELEKMNNGSFSANVENNRFDQTHFRKRSAKVVPNQITTNKSLFCEVQRDGYEIIKPLNK